MCERVLTGRQSLFSEQLATAYLRLVGIVICLARISCDPTSVLPLRLARFCSVPVETVPEMGLIVGDASGWLN